MKFELQSVSKITAVLNRPCPKEPKVQISKEFKGQSHWKLPRKTKAIPNAQIGNRLLCPRSVETPALLLLEKRLGESAVAVVSGVGSGKYDASVVVALT